MKNKKTKILKKVSRRMIPVSSLKGRVMPSRKRKLIEKALKRSGTEGHFKDD
jgi:CRISPR/Cas system CSM-associated protein Csm3 (group 7 of RAMP superfamily)